jgi:hypothetical protein
LERGEQASITCTNSTIQILLQPREPVLLNSEFNISGVLRYGLELYGVSGVSVYPWPLIDKLRQFEVRLYLYFSTIEFYVNNKPPSAYTCALDLVPDDSTSTVSIFHHLSISCLEHRIWQQIRKLLTNQSPYVFKNARFAQKVLHYQVESFLFVSLFRFQHVNHVSKLSINSLINQVIIYKSYNLKLDTGLLNPLVFEKLRNLISYGQMKSIQTD